MISLCREVCICHACYKQVSTNVNNPTFQPRWKPKQALPKAICSVYTCDETVYRNTNMASREQIEKLVGQKLVPFAIIVLLPLVLHSQSHYMYVHNSLHARQPCTSCLHVCSCHMVKRGRVEPVELVVGGVLDGWS